MARLLSPYPQRNSFVVIAVLQFYAASYVAGLYNKTKRQNHLCYQVFGIINVCVINVGCISDHVNFQER